MANEAPLVRFTEKDIECLQDNQVSGSSVVASIVKELELEKKDSGIQAHTNHVKHLKTR